MLGYLYNQKCEFERLKVEVQNTVVYLNQVIITLKPAVNGINESFQINDESGDLGRISSIYQELVERQGTLSTSVIYSINRKIREIQQRIDEEESIEAPF